MTRIASLLLSMLLVAACAARSVGTSKELVQARAAYAQAARSEAATEAPRSLEIARVTLKAAEEANRVDPGSQRERDLAFLALRRSQAAIADANAQLAQRDAETAREELRQAANQAGRAIDEARTDADKARADAEAARAAAEAEARQRQAAEQNAATARDSLSQAEADRVRAEAERVRAETERSVAQRERDDAVAAMKKLGEVQERDQSLVLALPSELMFRSGRATLLPRAREKLDELAAALLGLTSDQSFVIEGHTDARGSERSNYRLSRLRALAVRSYLIKRGVDPERIRAIGRGEEEPVASNESAEGRANNRRVEIVVTPSAVSKR